jgi:hypothetical protein
MPTTDGVNESDLNDQELAGLDKLESAPSIGRNTAASVWSNLWPKIGALVIGLFLWQVVVWSEWKPESFLGPGKLSARYGRCCVKARSGKPRSPRCGARLLAISLQF